MKTALALAVAMMLGTGISSAETPATQNCPPAATGNTGASGTPKPEGQRMEYSAILPDAGQHEQSAAATVQQDGKSVSAQADCPKPQNRIDAPKTQ